MDLPQNVTKDPNTGLFIITNSAGQRFRVNADTQSQLNQYVNSVNTGTPTSVTVIDPSNGNPKTSTFNPAQISAAQTSQAEQNRLLTAGKRQAGVLGNADGTYSDLKTGQTITQEQAAAKISAAGLPPETLGAITPKNSPAYEASQKNLNSVINTPSNLTASESQTPNPAIAADNAVVTAKTDPEVAAQTTTTTQTIEPQANEKIAVSLPGGTRVFANQAALDAFDAGGASAVIQEQLPGGAVYSVAPAQPVTIESNNANIANGSDPSISNGTPSVEQIQNAAPIDVDAEIAAAIDAANDTEAYLPDPNRTEQDIINAYGGMQGLQGSVNSARAQQITQDAENAKTQGDWRVRLSLAPAASYLYKAQNPGILKPLVKTDGVIFPYVPQIQVTYAAHYDPGELTHSNYKIFQYKSSSVDQISITCDFTAQDNDEANYMLAVIHFFRSVTKMFYGQDQTPKPGTPPPLCYLSGMGEFQFDRHPLVISSFNYSLPNDVDYIRAASPTLLSGVNSSGYDNGNDILVNDDASCRRIQVSGLNFGGKENAPNWEKQTNTQPTYVPTKISIALVAYPIVTRNDISNKFSLAEYATGKLLQGSKRSGGGIW